MEGEFTEDEIQSEKSQLEQELLKHMTDLEQIGQILARSSEIGLLQETRVRHKRDDLKGGETNG